MYPTSPRALRGLRSWAGRSAGTGERRRLSGPWGQANAKFSFAEEGREAGARERTARRLDQTETKRRTRACGCRCGLRTLTRFTGNVWRRASMSFSHRPTCRGTRARCTCGIRTGTCFGSARASASRDFRAGGCKMNRRKQAQMENRHLGHPAYEQFRDEP
jgi:hypothetical protein